MIYKASNSNFNCWDSLINKNDRIWWDSNLSKLLKNGGKSEKIKLEILAKIANIYTDIAIKKYCSKDKADVLSYVLSEFMLLKLENSYNRVKELIDKHDIVANSNSYTCFIGTLMDIYAAVEKQERIEELGKKQ